MTWTRCCCFSLIAICLVITTPSFAVYENNVEFAAGWLDAQQNSDGSWGSTLSEQLLYTGETVEALRATGRRNTAYYRGITWLENHAADNADYQARRASALAPHGDDVSTAIARLKALQNPLKPGRSGWGTNGQYLQSALDTAIVLNTLSTLSETVDTPAAVDYLKSAQLSDAGWPVGLENVGDPMTTAWVIKTLAPLRSLDPDLSALIGNGVGFLAAAVDGNSTHHLQGLAAHAALLADNTVLAKSWLDALKSSQSGDGSWSNRVYDTALTVRAMSIADGTANSLNQEAPVIIPDANLRAAINGALGRNALDRLDRGELSRLTTLTANGLRIVDLTGLEWAVNLIDLDLRNNAIRSTVPIDNLSLTRLLLAGNPVVEDTDSDGMSNQWESAYGLDIAYDDRLEDPDQDGFANFLESIERTDPSDPGSKPVAKYYILDPLTAQKDLAVISLYDGNVIHAGNTVLQLEENEAGTLPAADLFQGTLIWAEKPFSLGGSQEVGDMPVPVARFASTRLVIPHVRGAHRYYLISPDGDANVTVTTDGAPFDIRVPQDNVVTVEAGSTNGISGVLESDLRILAAHAGNGGDADDRDAYPVAPPAKSLWGIRSTGVFVGALEDNTQVTLVADNGARQSFTLNAGESGSAAVGVDAPQGQGSALHVVADKPVAAVQTGDGDGFESTAFLDKTGFGRHFGIPVDTQYVAVACLTPGTRVTFHDGVNSAEVKTCSGSGPGKVYFGAPANGIHIRAGAILASEQPVYVIYETGAGSDEHNLIGAP